MGGGEGFGGNVVSADGILDGFRARLQMFGDESSKLVACMQLY